jgi:hypothetical protein
MSRSLWCVALSLVVAGLAGDGRAGVTDDPACVIHFSFDDFSDTVLDESGKGHDGTVHGDVAPFADKSHRAAKFAGRGGPAGFSYVDLDGADFAGEDIPTAAITLAAWGKCENTGDHHAILNARASDNTWVVHPEFRSNGVFRWLLRAAGGVTMFDLQVGTVKWGEWQHYAGTYDKTTGKAVLYINGEVAGEQTVASPKDIAPDWGSGARIGYNIDNARPFTGLMDELYLFKRALTQTEVKNLLPLPPQLKAYAPDPANGAKNVMAPLLRWSAGETAAFHNVYLGTKPELDAADLVGARLTTPVYWHEPALTPGTTCYWRVDEIEADGVTVHEGDVWQFTTASLSACEPDPRDGAQWVDVEADLAWTTGTGAISHDLYFSTDKAAVEARASAAFKVNQPAPTYDPGTLAQNTRYYWGVDEHASDGGFHEGPVWSFTTVGPGAGVKVQYFRGKDFAGAPVLTQTEGAINHDWASGEVAAGLSDDVCARWTADFEVPFTETYQLITTSDDGVRLYLDGAPFIRNWKDQGSTDDIVRVNLVAGQVYALVMEWYNGSGTAMAKLSWQSPSIRRQIIPAGPLQLPVRATGQRPLNGAENVPQDFLLRWGAGGSATGHDIYFGEDKDAVANATPADTDVYRGRQALAETTYDPGTLEWGRTYWWRVDEVNATNPDSPWKGNVCGFTTADFLVVDDFESYTDEEGTGTRIYETWIDGWANGASGSRVGYLDPPFAEYKIVHSGWQSMPLDYNNVAAPFYSEAERTWDKPQDWTSRDVNTLTLYIRGRTTNGPDPLYVTLQDNTGHTGTVTCADSAIMTSATWKPWTIPLSDFSSAGVKITAVKKIVIGVGSRNATAPGGAGLIYLDDIWVTGAGSASKP